MKMSFRWYGETDPISLKYIRQIPNMRSVVTAVYDVKPGEVWPEESLKKLKERAEENGLIFDIVESVPVPEEIKLGTEKADEYTEVYCENIRRCAKYGVKCITYNCFCNIGILTIYFCKYTIINHQQQLTIAFYKFIVRAYIKIFTFRYICLKLKENYITITFY